MVDMATSHGFALDGYCIAYTTGEGLKRTFDVQGTSFVTQDFSLFVHDDGEALSFELTPSVPLVLDTFCATLAHVFEQGERVLLNGYQSWTDTRDLLATARMRGLDAVPRRLVDAYGLDTLGDYHFTSYARQKGCQHGFTYGVFKSGARQVLVASLDDTRGFTTIRTDANAGTVKLESECLEGLLEPGVPVMLGSYVRVAGVGDEIYDRWLELAGIKAREVAPLVGYCSWYRHYGDIDQAKLMDDLEGAKAAFAQHDTGYATRLFQIDDGFSKVGDWLQVDAAKFPDGLAAIASKAREAGFLPGLWLAPFVCEKESQVATQHSDWLLHDEAGQPVRTGWHWSGHCALDTRHPQVRNHLTRVLQTVTQEWGFGLLKLDFLYAACMMPHDGMNRGQLMHDALCLLREAVGEDVLLLGCGVPLAPAFGVVDYCRIGCDVGLDWDGAAHLRLLHRERVSTKNSLGNTLSRAPLDGRVFGNDPDVFFLRDDVKLSQRQRQRLLETDAQHGSMLLTSDNMGDWKASEHELFQRAIDTLLARKAR